MSDVQQAVFSIKESGGLKYVLFGEREEYRAWENGVVETRKSMNGQGRLLNEWRKCSTSKYSTDKHGGYYWSVAAWFGAKNYPRLHVVICTLFHGPRPSLKHQVNHIDGNRDNNSASNLEWVTAKENMQNAVDRGSFKDMGLGKGLLEEDDCRLLAIVTQMDADISDTELARRYDQHESNFSKLRNGKARIMDRFWYLLKKYNNANYFGADLPILKTEGKQAIASRNLL